MKKIWLIICIGTLIISCNHSNDNFTKIAVILPLTGESAELGTPILESMKLAEITANKYLTSIKATPIKLMIEDGKSTANGVIAAFNKMRHKDPAAFIIFGDVPCNNLASSVSKYHYPVIALGAAAANIPSLSQNYFRMWTASNVSGKRLAEYAKKELNKSNGAILYMNNNYGNEFQLAIANNFTNEGGTIVKSETYGDSGLDIKMQVQKIINSKPDVIFIIGFGTNYLATINYLKTMSYSGPILTDETITIPEYHYAVKEVLPQIYFSGTSFSPYDTNSDCYNTFVKPMMDNLNVIPNSHSVFGFASIGILVDAIERCGNSPESIHAGLSTLRNYNSIVGVLSYSKERELEIPVIIRKMNDDGSY